METILGIKFKDIQKVDKYKRHEIPAHIKKILEDSLCFILQYWDNTGKNNINHVVIFYPQFKNNIRSWVMAHSFVQKFPLSLWIEYDTAKAAHYIATHLENLNISLFSNPEGYIWYYAEQVKYAYYFDLKN